MKYTGGEFLLAICLVLMVSFSFIQCAYAVISTGIAYLKDGKVGPDGNKIYTVDYVTVKTSPDSPVVRYEVTQNSNVMVSETTVDLDYVVKIPDADNPSAYKPSPDTNGFRITLVEPKSDQLKVYTLQDNYNINPIPAILNETSPTTATLTIDMDVEKLFG